MEISTNSHQNLLIHSRKHLPTAPRHHPNCNVQRPKFSISSGRPLLARRRANSTSFLEFYRMQSGGWAIGEQSKMIQSWKQTAGCFRLDYVYIKYQIVGTVLQYADSCSQRLCTILATNNIGPSLCVRFLSCSSKERSNS